MMVTGTTIAFGALLATAIIAINSQSGDCDFYSPSWEACVSARSDQARSGIITAGIVGLAGTFIGGLLYVAGAGVNPHPVAPAGMRELADRHNQELKRRLGLSLLPVTGPDRAGLALDLRF